MSCEFDRSFRLLITKFLILKNLTVGHEIMCAVYCSRKTTAKTNTLSVDNSIYKYLHAGSLYRL